MLSDSMLLQSTQPKMFCIYYPIRSDRTSCWHSHAHKQTQCAHNNNTQQHLQKPNLIAILSVIEVRCIFAAPLLTTKKTIRIPILSPLQTQIHPPSQTMSMNEVKVSNVIVHPLVLLSVVDHFNRMGKIGNQKRVVGVLLGCWRQKGVLDVSNSFAGTNCHALQHGPFLRLTTNIVVVVFAYCLHIAQFPLTRTIRISRCGSSTTTTWTTCTACSRR